jgi:hypothetical protein
MTEYNDIDIDTEEEKQKTDWYKLINVFSKGNGDTKSGMELFIDMS